MAFAFVISATPTGNTPGNTATTAAINTTGCDLLVCYVGCALGSAAAATVTDSKGNTWIALSNSNAGSGTREGCFFYSKNPTVGSGHTFSAASAGGIYTTIAPAGYSGSHLTAPFDVENTNQNNNPSATSVTTGSVTPSQNGSLIVAAISGFWVNSFSVDSGFTVDQQFNSSSFEDVVTAYLIQGTLGAVNPTFTTTGSSSVYLAANIAVFKPAASSGPQTVNVTGVPTHRSFTALGVSNLNTISVLKVPTRRFISTPTIAGPLLVTSVPTHRSFTTPTVKLAQTVSVATVPSRQAFTNPRIANVKTISVAAVPTHRSFTTPAVSAGPQFISIFGVPPRRSFTIPTITGGNGRIRLYIAGIDVDTLSVKSSFAPGGAGSNSSAATIQSNAIGQATLTFDLVDTGQYLIPAVYTNTIAMMGLTVKVIEAGLTLFAGCIDTVESDWEMGTGIGSGKPLIVYHCTALDKGSILTHRVVPARVYSITDPFGSPLIVMIQDVILDIVATCLNGEGITTQGVPLDGSLGQLEADLPFNYQTVKEAFDQIATLAGVTWWVDVNGVLTFSPLSTLPAAPFPMDMATSYFRSVKLERSLSGGSATSGYRTSQYVVSNLNALPGGGGAGGGGASITETFTYTSGQPGIVDQPVNSGIPFFVKASIPIGQLTSLTVNGVTQVIVEFSQWNGEIPTAPPQYGPWFWQNGNPLVGPTLTVPTGATVVIEYIPGGNTGTNPAAIVRNPALNPGLGTCGSGIYEAVEQVHDIALQSDLDTIAQAILDRSGDVPGILTAETDKPGLAVGQVLDVLLPNLQLGTITPLKYLISRLSGVVVGSPLSPLRYGSVFRWQVEAISNLDPSNWITYYTRQLAQSKNPSPVLQYEDLKWVINSGGSLAGGVLVTNPQYCSRTGLSIEIFGGFNDPSVDEDTLITLTNITTGQKIGTLTIPSASTAQHTLIIPTSPQIWGFSKDTIVLTAAFVVTGPNPSPPDLGTIVYRRSM